MDLLFSWRSLQRLITAVLPAVLVVACNAESSASWEDDDLVAARCEAVYGAKVREKVAAARKTLEDLDTPYAATVRRMLDQKEVVPLPFCKMTHLEFDELAKDTDLTALGETREEQYRSLRRAEAPSMRGVHAQAYGFQWENRIYLATNVDADLMLATIAHEARHVERQAHARNFDDQRVTCIEELEAFEAEKLVLRSDLTKQEIDSLRRTVQDLYGLDRLSKDSCTYR